jgi:hypothetical protein
LHKVRKEDEMRASKLFLFVFLSAGFAGVIYAFAQIGVVSNECLGNEAVIQVRATLGLAVAVVGLGGITTIALAYIMRPKQDSLTV